ncbi:MAG: restriction endonuclease subunit R [Cyanobacteria bacterium J069]|nr:MAG: restriction endonuclease subunit R [Cyanobacteria bacterium J069]
MPSTIPAEKVTLYDLEQRFQLRRSSDAQFFLEWQQGLPELSEAEYRRIEHLKAVYANLSGRSVLENTVKMAIVSPLLDLAGFYLPPFYITTEEEVQIQAEDGETTIRGRIDVLVIKDRFWLLVIESKRAEFSLKVGIPQALTYMLASPMSNRPLYGMVTNGSNFVFLKLSQDQPPIYERSKEFLLEEADQLGQILQVLKRLAGVVASGG